MSPTWTAWTSTTAAWDRISNTCAAPSTATSRKARHGDLKSAECDYRRNVSWSCASCQNFPGVVPVSRLKATQGVVLLTRILMAVECVLVYAVASIGD